MTGRLLTPGEEYLDQRFMGDVPDGLDGIELTTHLLDAADEWLESKGYTFDAMGTYPVPEPHVSEAPVVDRMIHCLDARGTAVDFRSYPEPRVSEETD